MQKLAVGVFLSLLGYICLMLTSINSKIDAIYTSGSQYAMLSEAKPAGYTADRIQDIAFKTHAPVQLAPQLISTNAGLMIAASIAIFLSWHLSRIYHSHQWTKTILKKTFTHYSTPYVRPEPAGPLHADQDCVGEEPLDEGAIRESWLPPHAKRLYATWRRS